MEQGIFFDTMREGLWVATLAAMPILTVALFSGLLVGLFQALTSVQEMTLTFVPKLIAILLVFWTTMSFMTNSIVSFFQGVLIPLIAGA